VRRPRVVGLIVLGVAVLFAGLPLLRGPVELPVTQHHLLHAALLVGAALAGVLCGRRDALRRAAPAWIVLAMIAPILAMLLMWPSDYSFFEQHPAGHALEHVGIIACGFLAGFAGERFAAGVGWATGGSAVLMALLAAFGFGVAPPTAVPIAAVAEPSLQPGASGKRNTGASSPAQPSHGAIIYATNCAVCHGTAGEGVSGPSLKDERTRKNLRQTIEWIENPAPPMPKFYPAVLTAADVGAVATYVQTL
jgi:mono/diheme cytochrome c family protein